MSLSSQTRFVGERRTALGNRPSDSHKRIVVLPSETRSSTSGISMNRGGVAGELVIVFLIQEQALLPDAI